jgi:hypothetical protein
MSFNALPLLFSFYISVSGMGLFFEFLYKKDVDWPKSLLTGLVLFLAFQTYYVSFLILILWLLALSVTKIFRDPVRIAIRKMGSSMLNRKALISIIAFLVPLALLSPYVYIGLTHMTPAQQSYPSDIDMQIFSEGRDSIIKLVQQRVTFNWVLDIPTLADMLGRFGQIFTLASLAVCVIPVLYLVMKIWEQNSSNYGILRSLLLVYAFSLMLMGFLTFSTNLQVGKFILSFVDPERTWQNLLIPSVLLTSVILFFCGYATFVSFKFLRAHLRRKLFWDDVLERKVPRKAIRVVAVVLLSIFVFNLALVATNSFLPEFQVSYNEISSYLNTFSAIRQDDLVVMNWIKQNASKDSVILVSAGDSGQFLTAITQRKTVYSYDNRIHSQKYANLVAGLSSNAFNLNLVPSLLDYNISYVYVGSIATSYSNAPYRSHFNPEKLRNTPYFELVENSGDAWLFKFDPLLAKLDLDSLQKLDKCYYMDLNYPAMHVINLQNVSEYLDNCSFRRLDAEQLIEWLSLQIANGTAPESSLIMTMGVAPDMAVQGLDNTTLLRRYLDAGGRVTWIGDVPFFYQGHKSGSLTTWGLAGASTIINVNFELWDYNSTAASVTDKGFEWGMTLPDIAASQRPVSNDEITTILSEVEGYASSWQKNFNASYPNSGFIRYSYADYDGSDVDRNKDVVNLATIPLLFENSSHS